MPAYNFKSAFAEFVIDGTKSQTIRAQRKKGNHAQPGQKVFLYSGMRTKYCRKLGEALCVGLFKIDIEETHIRVWDIDGVNYMDYVGITADKFAYKDGFRIDKANEMPGPTYQKGSFEKMVRFFRLTHGLPFSGYLIIWKEFIPDLTSHITKKIKS